MIEPTDRGLTLGDGLFETVLAEGGALRHLPDHLDRLARGCAALGLPQPDRDEAERLMRQALAPLGDVRAAVRLTLTAGPGGRGLDRPQALAPTLFATAAPAPKPAEPASLLTSTVCRNDASPASRLKSLAYLDNVLARREAHAAGADEALMLNTRGELASAAAANIFWVKDGRLYTPHLDCGVLAGITRARIVAAAQTADEPVRAVRVGPAALRGVDGIFLTNSLVGLRPVARLDGHPVKQWEGLAALESALA